jgi:hypothetical protein
MIQHAEVRRSLPLAIAYVGIESSDAVSKVKQHRKDVFYNGLGAVRANVADRNSVIGRGLEVNVVGTGSGQADEPEGLRLRDQLAVKTNLVGENELRVNDAIAPLVVRRAGKELNPAKRIGERRAVQAVCAHGREIEKHGFHSIYRLFFCLRCANDDG